MVFSSRSRSLKILLLSISKSSVYCYPSDIDFWHFNKLFSKVSQLWEFRSDLTRINNHFKGDWKMSIWSPINWIKTPQDLDTFYFYVELSKTYIRRLDFSSHLRKTGLHPPPTNCWITGPHRLSWRHMRSFCNLASHVSSSWYRKFLASLPLKNCKSAFNHVFRVKITSDNPRKRGLSRDYVSWNQTSTEIDLRVDISETKVQICWQVYFQL